MARSAMARSAMARPFEFEMTSRTEADLHSPDIDCEKTSTHERFIPVREFKKEHLLPGLQDDDIVKCIKALGDLTVRIRCPLTSADRPDTMPNYNTPYPFIEHRGKDKHPRYATGWVLFVDREPRAPIGPCPCHLCQKSPTPESKFARIEIRTAAHHVYDSKEAAETTCDLFFDEGSKPGDDSIQLKSCSITQAQHDFESDSSDLTFFTHDMELVKKLEGMVSEYQSLHKAVKRKYPNNENSQPDNENSQPDNENSQPDNENSQANNENSHPNNENSQANNENSQPNNENSQPDNAHKLTVIVSHPHGCSKQVSVGEYVEVEPMENRDSLTRYFYTTASCPGSSGAPVFVLSRGWLWLLVEHAHCGGWNDELNYSGFALK